MILLGSGALRSSPCLPGVLSLSSFLSVTIWVTSLGSVCEVANFAEFVWVTLPGSVGEVAIFADILFYPNVSGVTKWFTALPALPGPAEVHRSGTNNLVLPALTIARIYKSRWQVELFFKWIKQHLRIKAFYGLSENAVKTQIWIAVSVYLLVAIVRKRLGLDASLYQILQILSLSLFEKTPILQALQAPAAQFPTLDSGNQLILFDF